MMIKQNVSIAMCTFNGAKYLAQQLDSIESQSFQPCELIVCDDRSTDGTMDIITEFASRVNFQVRLYVNEENIGSTKNFERAISLCAGDIIALADQDDVWHPEKLNEINEVLLKSPGIGLVFSDAEIVDEQLNPSGISLLDSFMLSKSERKKVNNGKAVNVVVKHSVVTGATMAFRRRFCDILLPFPKNQVHDNWISLVLSALTGFALIEKPLIKYRQHPNQQIGSGEGKISLYKEACVASMVSRNHYLREIDLLTEMHDRIIQFIKQYPVDEAVLRLVAEKIIHRQARVNLPAKRIMRIPAIVKEIVSKRYWIHSRGLKSVAKDMFF